MGITWDQIRRTFPDGKTVGGEWVCLCPAHNDKNHPNLSIKLEGGKLLVHCNAGCDNAKVFRAVLARLDKTGPVSRTQDIAPQQQTHGWSIAITKPQDAESRLKSAESHLGEAESFLSSRGINLQTARRLRFGFEPPYLVIPTFVDGEIASVKLRNTNPGASREDKWKKFRRQEKTYWLFNREALTTEDWSDCFVVESELDAAMLESKGYRAVSVDSAGHKLEAADATLLKSYAGTLVFSPDTDKPGISCALKIIEEAKLDYVSGIKTPTKDLGDLYASDPSAFDEKLAELRANPVPIWQFGFRSVAELQHGELKMLIKKIAPEGNNMVGAASGVGKTFWQLSQAKALCTGTPFLGVFEVPERMKVLYLIPESGDRSFRERCSKMRIPLDGSVFRCRTLADGVLHLSDPLLIAAIKDWHPVIFLDTAIRFADFKDENSSAENAGGLANQIFELLRMGAPGVFSAHHSPKRTAEANEKNWKLPEMTLENMLRGTGDIGAMLDCAWGLQPDDGGGKGEVEKDYLDESRNLTRLFVKCIKPRDIDPADPFRIQGRPYIDEKGDFVVLTSVDAPVEDVLELAAKLIEKDPTISVNRLSKKLGVSRRHFDTNRIPGWKWKSTSKTTGVWESTGILLPIPDEDESNA